MAHWQLYNFQDDSEQSELCQTRDEPHVLRHSPEIFFNHYNWFKYSNTDERTCRFVLCYVIPTIRLILLRGLYVLYIGTEHSRCNQGSFKMSSRDGQFFSVVCGFFTLPSTVSVYKHPKCLNNWLNLKRTATVCRTTSIEAFKFLVVWERGLAKGEQK